MKLNQKDQRLISRFVDGMLDGEERAAFERRLLAEPGLRAAVDAQRRASDWLRRDASNDDAQPSDVSRGFAAAVMEHVEQLPPRQELLAEGAVLGEVEAEQLSALRVGQRILVAAALVFAFGLLVWGGVLRQSDPRTLEASDIQRIEELDALFAAELDRARTGLRDK